jgi:hypothetical protein
MWRLSRTSGYSYLSVTLIRVDVHPAGEIWYTWHIHFLCRSTYAFRGQSPYVATFHADPTELDRFTAPEKKCSRLYLSARLSGLRDPPYFLSQHNHGSRALNPNIYWWIGYISLLGTYHQHVISTFNTCSRGSTHWSLTDTDGDYNLGDVGLPHHTPWPSQPMVLHFPPKDPARSPV